MLCLSTQCCSAFADGLSILHMQTNVEVRLEKSSLLLWGRLQSLNRAAGTLSRDSSSCSFSLHLSLTFTPSHNTTRALSHFCIASTSGHAVHRSAPLHPSRSRRHATSLDPAAASVQRTAQTTQPADASIRPAPAKLAVAADGRSFFHAALTAIEPQRRRRRRPN